jgi:HK97 family phage major capsid protein
MTKRLQKLMAEKDAAVKRMRALNDTADAADRDLSAEESAEYSGLEASLPSIDDKIAREQTLIEAERRAPRATNIHNRAADQPFANLGEQLAAIVEVDTARHFSRAVNEDTLARLNADASGANTTSGPDGGFAVRKDFAMDLVGSGYQTGILTSRCAQIEIGEGSDGLQVLTVDETSRANGSRWGGVQIYRRKEADSVAASRPKFGKWERELEDLMGVAYMTDRAMRDAPSLGQVFTAAFNEEFGFRGDDEVANGTGVGEMLGYLNSDALVTVDKEDGQAAGTVVSMNILKMYARLPTRSQSNFVTVYNTALLSQLMTMTVGSGSGLLPVWLPPGGFTGTPFATLLGRPALPIEQASAPGALGDIAMVDLSQYALIRKDGVQSDTSIHIRFLYGETAFRWVTRNNGAPKWKKALTPYKGADTLSPFVTLQART